MFCNHLQTTLMKIYQNQSRRPATRVRYQKSETTFRQAPMETMEYGRVWTAMSSSGPIENTVEKKITVAASTQIETVYSLYSHLPTLSKTRKFESEKSDETYLQFKKVAKL